ncbi:Uma2 family endonuclease [Baaleninema sp.]|uniref:Uma2 family endonuclease n=1 Tax=Baaleninema sp. TaxID=3101197 RepID=UPI003CFE4FAC
MTLTNTSTAKWSVNDYHQMIEAGILRERNVELLGGEIIEMTPEGPWHTVCGEGLANYLRRNLPETAWVREARPITLADSEPEPDIAIVRSPGFRYAEHHPYVEDIFWLIEVSDTTLAKDLNEKQTIYGKAGIPEYWVLNIKAKTVVIFREPNDNGYNIRQEVSRGTLASLAFPDLEIPLEKLFSGQILN